MTNWIDLLDFFVCGAMLLLSMLGLLIAVLMPGMDRWNRRFFTSFFSVYASCNFLFLLDSILYRFPDRAAEERVIIGLGYLLPSIIMAMLTVYLMHCCGKKLHGSPILRAVVGLLIVYFILLGIAQFTTCFYYITEDNLFIRGPWHPVLMAPMAAIMVLTLSCAIRWRDALSRKRYCAFLICLIPLTVAVVIHTFIYVPLFLTIGITLSMLMMFTIILLDEIEQHMRHQQEIIHQRASIMVLQMRPHFIYNTMMSIYYLCKQDPDLAQQVTLDFTTYLRKNFTAIASEAAIPFSEELAHTRAYLAVEQAQFDDRLFVNYDTPHTLFSLPPLTLQPIVENAVKHGMDPDSEPLHISIKTLRTDSGSEITVEDNGPGFDPAGDAEPHFALSNIRERLTMMCDGKLSITPRTGGGTVVRVTIPGQTPIEGPGRDGGASSHDK